MCAPDAASRCADCWQDVRQPMYQVREGQDGQLMIGFEKIAASLFQDEEF